MAQRKRCKMEPSRVGRGEVRSQREGKHFEPNIFWQILRKTFLLCVVMRKIWNTNAKCAHLLGLDTSRNCRAGRGRGCCALEAEGKRHDSANNNKTAHKVCNACGIERERKRGREKKWQQNTKQCGKYYIIINKKSSQISPRTRCQRGQQMRGGARYKICSSWQRQMKIVRSSYTQSATCTRTPTHMHTHTRTPTHTHTGRTSG